MNINNNSSLSFGMAFKQTSDVTDAVADLASRALKIYEKRATSVDKISEKARVAVDVTLAKDGADKFCANLISKNDAATTKTIVYDSFPQKAGEMRKFFRALKRAVKDFGRFCNIKSKFGE